jgi:hypothetical protein
LTLQFQFREVESMPKLGWIAVVNSTLNRLNVFHGRYVEQGPYWVVEGVWDGRFQDGNFDRSACFYGSGVKINGTKINFVPSIANTDRVLVCRDKNLIIASNSLLLLLAYTGASLDDQHDYVDESTSIILHGLTRYNKRFKVVHPRITHFLQIFRENVVVENGEVSFEPKPQEAIRLKSFEDYYSALLTKLASAKKNYTSPQRRWLLKDYTTLSTGYDSTAVSCLAKMIGVSECFTGRPLDGLIFRRPAESSSRIGKKLGFRIHRLDSSRKNISKNERYFLAGNYPRHSRSVWSEISLHSMVKAIQTNQSPAVVFMGYCGDDVWGNKIKIDPQTGDLLATPPISGSNLAEIRLTTGFMTLSPAYMFIRNISKIQQITHSGEMDPWRLGRTYDRPIPRRIAEEAGIPREWFGMKKSHITTTYFWPINHDNRQAFFKHLKNNLQLNKRSIAAYYLHKRFRINLPGKSIGNAIDVDLYDDMRKWATEVLKTEYSNLLNKQLEV